MTTLVTGATGFIGSAVVRRLLEAGHDVRALVRPISDRRNVSGLPIDIVVGDLQRPDSLAAALHGCEALFHVAADYRLWVRDDRAMLATNVDGTRRLMNAAGEAGVRRIVYTSSVAVIGHAADGRPADEAAEVRLEDMIGPYKRSKFLAEQIVRDLAERGLPVVIVNPTAPVGPRDIKPTPTGRMIAQAAAGRLPAYVDTGLNIVDVDDVAHGHLLAFERGRIGERYILGGENMTLREILALIAHLMGRPAPRLRIPYGCALAVACGAEAWSRLFGGEPLANLDAVRMARVPMFFGSTKARDELGFRARPAAEALARAVAWFRAIGLCP
jgi:dihydroflavonol-4-reductase